MRIFAAILPAEVNAKPDLAAIAELLVERPTASSAASPS
jgi:hypothetical protein